MQSTLSKSEAALLWSGVGLLALAVFGPPLGQPPRYHDFADQRTLWAVPFAMDVLSNLAFALAGLAGVLRLAALPSRTLSNMQRAMAGLFFTGLVLTAAASGWYHWQPDDAGLVVDRCAMAVAFAGLLGLGAADRVSERAGAVLGLAALLLGPLAVRAWSVSGNAMPWAALQFGGIALILWLTWLPARRSALDVRWSLVILAYAIAKLLEIYDAEVYRLTGQLVSGHTLKHIVASLAAWPVLAAIGAARHPRQNRPGGGSRRALARRLGDMDAMHRSGQ